MKTPRPSPRCFGVEWVGRGDATNDPYLNREPGAFAVAIAEVFSFREDWYQDERANPLVRQYQLTLDAVLRDHPKLRDCVVRCCHCGIRFLTHPRNARRQDLRCPFGCRRHHQRERANARSRKRYQTPDGQRNKKRHNGKRSKYAREAGNASPGDVDASSSCVKQLPLEEPTGAQSVKRSDTDSTSQLATPRATEEASRENVASPESESLPLEGLLLDEPTLVNSPILPYVLMVASIIERRTISCDELIAALRKSMRQRSFDRRPRREYVLCYLHEHPP